MGRALATFVGGLRRAIVGPSPAREWLRAALLLEVAAALLGGVALAHPTAPLYRQVAEEGTTMLAALAASAACLAARSTAAPGGRATWLLVALGAMLVALGQGLSARIELVHLYAGFPSAAFFLFVAFHLAFAEGAILALRPSREPRLAVEIALDGLLVLLAVSALVLRFLLDAPLAQGWLPLSQGVAMLLGEFAVTASLFFVALLVFWRDAELAGPVADGLLVSALFFAFGNILITFGLDTVSASSGTSLYLVRLAGWLALSITAALAVVLPEPSPAIERRALAARRFRQLIIPGAALFLTAWALDAARRTTVTSPSRAVIGAMGIVLAARIGAALYAVEKEAEERRSAEESATRARIRALTAQMSPHFLFNALHSLSALVRRDAAASERALERLGGLLRYGLDASEQFVSVRDEWRFASDYLDLEALRFGPRLEVVAEMDEDVLDLSVPPFILQPLVENAIKHGVSPMPGGGRVTVRGRRDGPDLIVEVCDTGPGATSEAMENAPGVGVRGVRAQLQSHLGEGWRMETETPATGGFVVRLVLPADEG